MSTVGSGGGWIASLGVRGSLPTLALALAGTVVIMGGVALAGWLRDIPAQILMGDPAAIVDGPFYLGAVTLLRTAILAGSAGACLLAGYTLRGRARGRDVEFLTALGCFQAALVLDDKFQGHEAVLGQILGVPELVTFGAIGAVAVAGVVRYRTVLRSHPHRLVLVGALGLFALGVIIDQSSAIDAFIETSAEVAGVLCLALFGIRSGAESLAAAVASVPPLAVDDDR